MGDIADNLTEQGEDMYFDHVHGHHHFPPEDCPYCYEENSNEQKRHNKKIELRRKKIRGG